MEFEILDSVEINKNRSKKNDRSQFEEAAYLLKALANETRLCVVMELSKNKEMTVSDLLQSVECEQSLLSHHLTDMRAKGILNCRKSGRNNYYSLKDKRATNLLKCLVNCDTGELKLS